MTDDGDVNYRYQTVKVIRGREANKITEMERQGWEVDQQTTGRLRTEITFRRIVPPTRFKPWMGIAALLGIGVILLGGVAIAEAVGGDDDSDQATDKPTAAATTKSAESSGSAPTESTPTSAASSETSSETVSETSGGIPSETPSATPTEQPSSTLSETPTGTPSTTTLAADEVLTVRNSPDLRKLLAKGESGAVCKTFAKTYAGRTIEFDGSVSVAGGGTYLVYAGDDSDTEYVPGPSFQFRTLTVEGGRPAPGDNLHFVAKVGTYNAVQGLFGLTQVATTRR